LIFTGEEQPVDTDCDSSNQGDADADADDKTDAGLVVVHELPSTRRGWFRVEGALI
jgi:hypothetical protein